MNTKYLTTEFSLYKVNFRSVSRQFVFSGGDAEQLGNLIQLHGKHGIDKISRYNESKEKFEKMNKKDVQSWFSYDTHTIEQLKKINFIK